MSLRTYLDDARAAVDLALDRLLPPVEGPQRTVAEAMRYAIQGGGKRLRPAIALAACEACGGRRQDALAFAAAVEMIHTYSLVHDDLPAMDDDDLRRGRPTVHRRFDEAVAILAGDALHTIAFEIVATGPAGLPPALRSEAVAVLARAAGVGGMVGGQIADLEAERATGSTLEDVVWIHRHKTGALLAASAELGAVAAGAAEPIRDALRRYGDEVGLAFQIADDVLDCTGTASELGKTPGKDVRSGKSTFPSLLGLEESRRRAAEHARRAIEALGVLERPAAVLEEIARYAVERSS